MKALLIFALLVAAGVLYFHDKNEAEQVVTLQAQVDDLTGQLSRNQQALNAAQAQLQRLGGQLRAPVSSLLPPSGGLQMDRLGGNALDRPATSSGGGRRH